MLQELLLVECPRAGAVLDETGVIGLVAEGDGQAGSEDEKTPPKRGLELSNGKCRQFTL